MAVDRDAMLRQAYCAGGNEPSTEEFFFQALASTTQQSYQSAWKFFMLWCYGEGLDPRFPSVDTMLRWIHDDLAQRHRQFNCIHSVVSGVWSTLRTLHTLIRGFSGNGQPTDHR